MNKLLFPFFNLLLIASLVSFSSCKDDDGEEIAERPSFAVVGVDNPSAATVDIGEPLSFTMNINAPAGYKSLRVSRKLGASGTAELFDEDLYSGPAKTTHPYEFIYTASPEEAGQEVIFDFEALDNANQSNTYQYVITVNEPQLRVFNDVTLVAQMYDQASNSWVSESWLSLTDGTTYQTGHVDTEAGIASNQIDLGYFWSDNTANNASLASPHKYPKADLGHMNWQTRNQTKLRATALTAADFEAMATVEQLQQAFEQAAEVGDDSRINNLSNGHVVVFMTDANRPGGSKFGALLVQELTAGRGGLNNNMKLQVKLQPSEE